MNENCAYCGKPLHCVAMNGMHPECAETELRLTYLRRRLREVSHMTQTEGTEAEMRALHHAIDAIEAVPDPLRGHDAEPRPIWHAIMRDVCELSPANPEDDETICVTYEQLNHVLVDHLEGLVVNTSLPVSEPSVAPVSAAPVIEKAKKAVLDQVLSARLLCANSDHASARRDLQDLPRLIDALIAAVQPAWADIRTQIARLSDEDIEALMSIRQYVGPEPERMRLFLRWLRTLPIPDIEGTLPRLNTTETIEQGKRNLLAAIGGEDRAVWLGTVVREIDRLIATVKRESKPAWASIETAPKDGTWFLAWDHDGGCYVYRMGPGFFTGEDPSPTHWLPLPAPPEATR